MSKNYNEMNAAERMIMNYLQVYEFQRINAHPTYDKTDTEKVLEQIAKDLDLIE